MTSNKLAVCRVDDDKFKYFYQTNNQSVQCLTTTTALSGENVAVWFLFQSAGGVCGGGGGGVIGSQR